MTITETESTTSNANIPDPTPNNSSVCQPLSKLHAGLEVSYKNEKGQTIQATIDSRAGKVKGNYPHWWNTTRSDGLKEPIDFSKVTDITTQQPDDNIPLSLS